jgi:hypothetical protein
MAKYGEISPSLIGETITVKPTEGGYQKDKEAVIMDETKTLLMVRVDGEMYNWKFSKKDLLRTGRDKNEFPRYMLDIEL